MIRFRLAAVGSVVLALALALPGAVDARVKVLKRFTSCDTLVTYAKKYAPRVAPYYGPTIEDTTGPLPPTAAPTPAKGAPDDTSTTNNQEAGVDEPDTVKTDGRTLFVLTGGGLNAIDARAATPKLLSRLSLEGGADQLLISEDRALVIGSGTGYPGPVLARPALAPTPFNYRPTTRLTEVDISDPRNLKVVRTLDADGYLVDARLTGSTARVVIQTRSWALDQSDESMRGKATGWVPTATLTNKKTRKAKRRSLAPCDAVRRPRVFGGLDMVTVLTIDVAKGLPAIDSDAVMTDADTVYASPATLYLASRRWTPPDADQPPGSTTQLHAFDISQADRTEYRATGDVAGYLLNQFSMSEENGILRVATTQERGDGDDQQQQSYVTTLERRLDKLVQLGRVGGLGKGERVYAVRFLGDVGYVVTFRQIDPLYTIDLSDPRAPKVLGELELLGYSAYLHPVGDGLLLGVGQDATPEGRRGGLMVQLFDVSDVRAPKRLDREVLPGYTSSQVEWDHHAFLFWPKTGLAVVPFTDYTAGDGSDLAGAIGYRVAGRKLARVGTIDGRGESPVAVDRSVVVGDRLFTISTAGVLASDLDSLAAGPFLPFAAPGGGGGVQPVP